MLAQISFKERVDGGRDYLIEEEGKTSQSFSLSKVQSELLNEKIIEEFSKRVNPYGFVFIKGVKYILTPVLGINDHLPDFTS